MMPDLISWPPERMRALDRAVAVAVGWIRPEWADAGLALPEVSLGCRDTFELQIKGFISLTHGAVTHTWYIELERDEVDEPSINGPTIPIAWCLAYLAAEGVPFNG